MDRAPSPVRTRGPARALRIAAASVLVAVMLSACADTAAPAGGGRASADRDPLADLDRATWSVVDAPSMMARPLDRGDVDAAAWAAAGIDDASITATRQALTDFVVTAYLRAEARRETDDAADERAVLAATPEVWRDELDGAWSPSEREFYAAEFAPPYRTIGVPHATADWYLTERDGDRLVEVGGTIAYSVLDPTTGRTGIYAMHYGISAVPATGGAATPASALSQVSLHGMDTCRTDEAEGLLVPAIDGSDAAVAAQRATRSRIIEQPTVTREDLAAQEGGILQADPETAVLCEE